MARGPRVAFCIALAGLASACEDTHVVAQLAPVAADCSFDGSIHVVHGRLDLALADRYVGLLRVEGEVSLQSVELRDVSGAPLFLPLPNPFQPEMARSGDRVELDLVPRPYAAELGALGDEFEIVAAVAFGEASWAWPIAVCRGCLVQCADAPTALSCLPGQDLPSLVQHGEPGFEELCPAR